MNNANLTLRIKTNDESVKTFTDTLQETFLLRYLGLMNKEISDVLKNSSEDAVTKRIERCLEFFVLEDGKRSIEAAVSIAAKNGLGDYLIKKYRDKHKVHIERWERAVKKFTIVGE
jgi:hypothetical protein